MRLAVMLANELVQKKIAFLDPATVYGMYKDYKDPQVGLGTGVGRMIGTNIGGMIGAAPGLLKGNIALAILGNVGAGLLARQGMKKILPGEKTMIDKLLGR